MISGIDLSKTRDYVLKKDKTNPTIWKIGSLPASVAGLLADNTKANNPFEIMLTVFRLGLKGWDNFALKGSPAEFRTEKVNLYGREVDMVAGDLADAIPISVITELAIEIQKDLSLSQVERKN